MNKAYRIVWSKARSAFIVTHEKSSSRGRASTTCAATMLGIAALLLNAGAVSAANLCTGGATEISTVTSGDNCVLGAGASVELTSTGAISSNGMNAIYTSATVGSITNHGSVASDISVGIHLDSAVVEGTIRNTGTLTSVADTYDFNNGALFANRTTITGSLVNDGGLIGNTLLLRNSSVDKIENINGGSIAVSGQQIAGIRLDRTTVANGILNAAGSSITTSNYPAINIYGGNILAGGIVNNGDIFKGGISLDGSANVVGGITNTGRMEDIAGVGIGISGSTLSGGIHNTGTILSGGNSVLINSAAQVTGGFTNESNVTGTSTGIYMEGRAELHGGLTNTGTIAGTNLYAIQALSSSVINGGIQNSGTIEGQRAGIRLLGGSSLGSNTNGVALYNSGNIFANGWTIAQYSGLQLLGGSTVTGNIVNTANAMISGNYGISVTGASTIDGNIANSGIISGSAYAVYVSDDSTLKGLSAHGSSASYRGDIYAKNTDFTVASGASFMNENAITVQGFTIAAGGLLTFSDGISRSGTMASGINVGSNGFTNAGTLRVNSGLLGVINGDYTQTSTGVLQVGVTGDTAYGYLTVNGTANLGSNAKIDVDVSPRDYKFNVDRLQNFLTASTLNSDGTFRVTDNSTLFDFGAVKDGNAVHLTLKKAGSVLGSVNENGNKLGTGAATVLDQIIATDPTGGIASHFVGLTSTKAVSDAVSQTLPLLNGGSMAAATGSITSINRVVQARIENNRGLSSGDDVIGDQYVWFKPFGSWARQDDRDGQSGFKANSTGFVAGADMAVNERSRLGAGFAYAKSKVDGNSAIAPQHMDVDVFQLLGYGSYSLDENTEVNFQADIGQNSNKGSRRIAFTGSTASADYKSLTAHVGIGIGRILQLNANTSFTPSVRADYTWIKDQSYRESGAGALNLNVDGRSANELLLAADGKLAHKLNDKTTFVANLGAAYTAVKGNTAIIAAFAGAPQAAFATYGMEQRPWTVRGGLGLVRKTGNNTEIAVRYDAEARNGFTNQTASVKARWSF